VAIVLTPLIYVADRWIENYLGHQTAATMKQYAMGKFVEDPIVNIPAAG
jgi:hypothetical protein